MNGGQLPHEYGKGYDLIDSAEAAREMADSVRDGHGLPENIDSLLTNLSESTTNEVMWETFPWENLSIPNTMISIISGSIVHV